MAQIETLYTYLLENYKPNEPVFLSDINVPGMRGANIRQQLKKLTEDGRLKRFDTGIYFLPKKSMFRSGSSLSVGDVIRKKYLMEGNSRCGYISGMLFANQLGLTTQVPSVYEIYTNKATTDYRETKLSNLKIILRKPYVPISEKNHTALQFLDLLKEITEISELQGEDLKNRLLEYMKNSGLDFTALKPFLSYYPEKIYKNMYEAGLLYGVSA